MKNFVSLNGLLDLFVTCACLFGMPLAAGDSGNAVSNDKIPITSLSLCDVLDGFTLHKSEESAPFQKFTFTGRLQADAIFFDAEQGEYDALESRRARVGFKSLHFDRYTIHSEVDLELNDVAPLYGKLTDSYIAWSPNETLVIRLGKQGASFTLDGATSSKDLLRLERSLLSTNIWFPEEYFTGASVSGKTGNWVYNMGVFSSDGGKEFGNFEAGSFGLLSLGYDFADALGLDKAFVRADYVHNDPTALGLLNTRSLSNVGSLNATFEQGRWGVRADVSAASGWGGQSDLAGLAVMPYYSFSDHWQLVASYNYLSSDEPNGIRLDRYESRIESGRADEVHEFYFGVNRYLCGHKLKWQTGVEYTSAADSAADGGTYKGWGLTSGIRIAW